MSGTQIRVTGVNANYVPVIKRGVATLTDGRVATLVIDSNVAGTGGVDVTGVAKICVYLSSDASRTTHALAINYTPPVAPSSSTRYPVASMTSGVGNILFITWQGVDNALYVSRWTYSAGAFTFVSTQTVVAASAVVNRFRAVDIDVAGADRPIVATYEANASSGQQAFVRAYVLRTDNTTWTQTFSRGTLGSTLFIKPGSEDVCIAWRGDGITANVGRYIIYGTATATTVDGGDFIQECSGNVSTGASTVSGTWFTTLNKNNAAGSRRLMIFSLTGTLWLIAGVYGTSTPRFFAAKLTTSLYGAPTFTYAGYVSSIALSSYFKIDATRFTRQLWSATYKDNRLSFGFVGPGTIAGKRVLREIIFTYANVSSAGATATIDQVPRRLYGELNQANWESVTLYGGDNKRVGVGLKTWNYAVAYFQANLTTPTYRLMFDFVAEDTFNPPVNISPANITWNSNTAPETTNRPVFRVRVDNTNLTPNLYGKLEIQIASDTAFTANVKSIVQPDSALQYFGNKDGLSGAGKIVSVQATAPAQYLYSGTWYFRSRIVSDKDTPGEWSTYSTFAISHPPVATPLTPARGVVIAPLNNYVDNMVVNGSATTGVTTPQTGLNGTLTYSTVQSNSAPGSFRMVPNGVGAEVQVLSPTYATTPGQQFTAKGWIRPDTVNKSIRVQISYYDAASVYLGGGNTTVPAVAGTWTQLSVTASSAGLGAVAFVQMGVGETGTPAAGDAFYVDDMEMVQSSGDVVFSWRFSDTEPNDSQTAYNLIVTRTDTGAAIISTGWIATGATSSRQTFNDDVFEVPLTWTIQLKDADGVAGATITPQDFTVGYLPKAVIVTPAYGSTVTTATPTITWSYFSGGGRVQRSYRIYIKDFVTNKIVADTYWRVGAETSYTFPTNVLENLGEYDFVLMVTDETGLYDEDLGHMEADWIEPALGNDTITVDNYKVRITWDDSTKDTEFISWRVYRRYMTVASVDLDVDNSATTWVLLYETADDLPSYTYDDYQAPLNKPIDYVVVQVVDRFGSIIESDLTSITTVTINSDRYYFVPEIPVGTIVSYESNSVTGDSFTKEIEQETLHVIGRGRQVQIGDDLGYSGSLTLKLRDPATARRNREFLEMLSAMSNSVYIKTPFGDVVLCSLGSIQTNRQAGFGGGADITDLTVPYLQVIAPEQIKRSI